ncbi:MAG: Transcriptional regulator, family, partial [Frondihabitans sp.]|nr:Transcriptional regulator, family [Frondihabitans sp.]
WSSFVAAFGAYLAMAAPGNADPEALAGPVSTLSLPPGDWSDTEPKIRWDVPRQLPGRRRAFVNRTAELDLLETARRAASDGGRAAVAVIRGSQGMGKSALGERWAHLNRDRFSDGQLYVDFAEIRQGGEVSMSDALSSLLRGFGVAEHAMPRAYFEKVQKYRTITAGRRVLVVLDDVEHAAQVLPLIPDSAHAAVIVTTRMTLDELTVHGATSVSLETLKPDNAIHLLRELLGDERCTLESEAVQRLAGFCAGLPIAITICAAILNSQPGRPILNLVDELKDENTRLSAMSLNESVSIQKIFDIAVDGLPTRAERLYGILGASQAPSFSAHSAAAASGTSLVECSHLLDMLCTAQLLDPLFVDGERRYRFHDLLRVHARQRSSGVADSASTATAVVGRMVEYYAALAMKVDRALTADRLRYAPTKVSNVELPTIGDVGSALLVFERERPSLVAVQFAAEAAGYWTEVWTIAEALWPAYHARRHPQEAREVFGRGADAAGQAGQEAVRARLLTLKARTEIDLGLSDAARFSLSNARAAANPLDDDRLTASIDEVAAILALDDLDYELAERFLADARDRFQRIGEHRGAAIQDYLLGKTLHESGDDAGAVASFARASTAIEVLGDDPLLCRIGLHRCRSLALIGDRGQAKVVAEHVADIAHRCGADMQQAAALELLASFFDHDGDAVSALTFLERALALYIHARSALADSLADQIARRRA